MYLLKYLNYSLPSGKHLTEITDKIAMRVFDGDDYKKICIDLFQTKPNRGRGQLSRLAKFLGVNATLVSQILNGPKDFTIEQALSVSEFLGLPPLESEYFVLLVQRSRAGTSTLKKFFDKRLLKAKQEALQISERLQADRTLTETERSIFYSSWIYSAVRMFTSVHGGQSFEAICKRFDLSTARATEILHFLTSAGLCRKDEGFYKMGAQQTHLEKGSPYFIQNTTNWRMKTAHFADKISDNEIIFTACLSIGVEDFNRIREQLVSVIQSVAKQVKSSKSDEVALFNLDWLWVGK